MIDMEKIKPQEGILPPRPSTLRPLESIKTLGFNQTLSETLKAGKTFAYGGLSILEFRLVQMVGIFQLRNNILRGWQFTLDHPHKHDNLEYLDSSQGPLKEMPCPNGSVYFLGEADDKVVEHNIPPEILESIITFILPFISENGPPQGIDWPFMVPGSFVEYDE